MLLVGLGLALDRSGWMMSTVLALNHVSSPAQTVVLDPTIAFILRMWLSTVAQVVEPSIPTELLISKESLR